MYEVPPHGRTAEPLIRPSAEAVSLAAGYACWVNAEGRHIVARVEDVPLPDVIELDEPVSSQDDRPLSIGGPDHCGLCGTRFEEDPG